MTQLPAPNRRHSSMTLDLSRQCVWFSVVLGMLFPHYCAVKPVFLDEHAHLVFEQQVLISPVFVDVIDGFLRRSRLGLGCRCAGGKRMYVVITHQPFLLIGFHVFI